MTRRKVGMGLTNLVVGVALLGGAIAQAQAPAPAAGQGRAGGAGRAGGPPAPPQTAQQMAPIDLTGYWVAVISEDWRWRMVTPAKGDVASIPLTPEGFKTAQAWDPAKDEAAGEQCRAYGAAGLMRTPTRLHITWADANTLRMDTDYGTQTRLFHFGSWTAPAGPATWQGASVAKWEGIPRGRGGAAPAPTTGSLSVVTTKLRPGYLRKNGVPYSANTVLNEYWDLTTAPNGDKWIVITSIVTDPANLQLPFTTALQFKKEADGSKWDPTPCNARW